MKLMDDLKWSLIKVNCNDGVVRLGMIYDGEAIREEDVLESGLEYDYLCKNFAEKAAEHGLPPYNGENGEYDAVDY
jgi:hypothetical protein